MRSSGDNGVRSRETGCPEKGSRKCDSGSGAHKLYIVGLGPGIPDHMSRRALEVLESVEVIVGYTTYVDLIRPLIKNQEVISTAMKKEVERVSHAVDISLKGRSCAIVSSGDPGIYAMAGLVFEVCREKNIPVSRDLSKPDQKEPDPGTDHLTIEIVPGIPALASGASLLGAPLSHDFAAISLSDLLTSWEAIEKKIKAASEADFVIVLYNPKSKKRNWQLDKARDIILKHRSGNTPVGVVTGAMRENQKVEITTLENLDKIAVSMQTTIFIGSSTSDVYMDFMVTPRGYSGKYDIRNQ